MKQLDFLRQLEHEDTFEAGVLAALAELRRLDTNNMGMLHPVTEQQIYLIKEALL